MPRSLDEDDVPIRPGGANRRRSRLRPEDADAREALITTVDRGRSTCRLLDSGASVVAVRGADVRRTPVVVGDRVRLVGDRSGRDGTLARIISVAERVSVLRRTPDDTDPAERPIVANADQLIVVVALTSPPARPRMIDRCLVAAYDGGLDAGAVPHQARSRRQARTRRRRRRRPHHAHRRVRAARRPGGHGGGRRQPRPDHGGALGQDQRPVRPQRGRKIDAGQPAGPGRLPGRPARSATSAAAATSSSSVIALELPGGGWVVDTPGVRSFGLGLVSPARVLSAFEDLAAVTEECPRGCTHLADSPDCMLDTYAATGAPHAARVDSLRRLLLSRESPDD